MSEEKSFSNSHINWFPGHMAKTRRQIEEDLKLVDIVIELLDARIPISSQNPDLKNILKNKTVLKVLNKSDLSDGKENKRWKDYFTKQGIQAVIVNSNSGNGIEETIRKVEEMMKDKLETLSEKGRTGRKVRAMIVGIPNVGKSSFINRVAKKNSTEVGNKPGVTKSKQWIRINDKVELLDTPGVLWPKFENEKVALNLSFTGTIKDDILAQTEIAYQLLKYLLNNYIENICERYNFKREQLEEILQQDNEENVNIYEIMLMIGKKRGALIYGGNIDDEKTAKIILDDFRTGKLGNISLEKVQ
jgi:ribosome biogenesis GTPase A